MSTKLATLVAAGTRALTDLFYGEQGGVERKFTIDDFSVSSTATVTLGDGTNNYTLTTDTIYLERVGKKVYVKGRIFWTSIGAATSAALVLKGLPYQSSPNVSISTSPVSFGISNGVAFGTDILVGEILPSTTEIIFYLNKTGATAVALAANAQSATGEIRFSLEYVAV